jgi:hypothetical protein
MGHTDLPHFRTIFGMMCGLVNLKDGLKHYYKPLRVLTFFPITNAFNCKQEAKIISLVALVLMVIFGGLHFFAWFPHSLHTWNKHPGGIVLVLHFTIDILRCTYSLTDKHGY